MNEETVVQNEQQAEDVLSEELVEEQEDTSESLESAFADEGKPAEDQQAQQDPQGTGGELKEPGYVKKRIESAVAKALADYEAKMEARYAPLQERLFEMDAQELVRSGKVKDLETAKELVRYRNGMPAAPAAEPQQPRNAQGQFTRQEQPTSDPATSARIDMLQHQANRIKANGGPDVIDEFKTNPEIRQKVINGEMDFYEVAEQMRSSPKRKAPSPMRSPNGASGSQKTAIDNMTDEQFARLEKRISEGARYSLR